MPARSRAAALVTGLALWAAVTGSPAADPAGDPPAVDHEKLLREAGLQTDTETLIQFFRSRTLSQADRDRLLGAIGRLGDEDFDVREAASAELTRAGLPAVPLLRAAGRTGDEEVTRRAERCLSEINQQNETQRIVSAAHVLARRRAPGTARTLLTYLPNVPDDETVTEAVRSALTELVKTAGRADPDLLAALADKDANVRALAAEVIGRALPAERPAVKKLLADADPKVRFTASVTLLQTGDKGVMTELLRMLADGPVEYAYQVEDVLCQLAGDGRVPATLAAGDAAARQRCRAAWEKWWEANTARVDPLKLTQGEPVKGMTLVLEVDGVNNGNGTNGRVWECAADGKQRWEWLNVSGPVDIQPLPGGRYLLAEYYAARVTERDREGKILWESPRFSSSAVAAQRLANGNTLVATMGEVFEIGRDGKAVHNYQHPNGTVFQTRRARNGHTFILGGNELWEMDADRKPLRKINVGGLSGWGGFDFVPNGHFLVSYYAAARKYAELNGDGKVVAEHVVNAEPSRVQRLRNGNVLIAGGNTHLVTEYDRDQKEVWKVTTKGRPFCAVRY